MAVAVSGAAVAPSRGYCGEVTGSENVAVPDRDDGAILSRLLVIDDQPLESRAEAYVHIHEQLRLVLEGGDSTG